MNTFAVLGYPIKRSLSPQIHQYFSQQTGIPHSYYKIEATPDNFESTIRGFFAQGGLGANITTPFKARAYWICDEHTEQAKCTGVVNTLKILKNNQLLGDNTDGRGLLTDLKRLNLITPDDRVLLIGAGGAAQGVIPSLLPEVRELVITNRTVSRAQKLRQLFHHLGKMTALEMKDLKGSSFDLIIHATSSGMFDEIPSLPSCIFSSNVRCYDMFYSDPETTFIHWIKQKGVIEYADGRGMLVAQAAHSFYLWHNVMPEITGLLSNLSL